MKYLLCYLFLILNLFSSTLVFYGDNKFAPYSYEENGELKGIDIEIIKEIGKRLDLDIKIELVPWNRLIELTKQGKVHGSFSLFYNNDRSKYAYFTNYPIHYSKYSFFTLDENGYKYNKFEDIYGKKIGLNRSFYINEAFENLVDEEVIYLDQSEDIDKGITLLLNKRIDLYLGNEENVYRFLEENNITKIIPLSKDIFEHYAPAFLVLSKKSDLTNKNILLNKINKTLEELYNEGTIDKIKAKYLLLDH